MCGVHGVKSKAKSNSVHLVNGCAYNCRMTCHAQQRKETHYRQKRGRDQSEQTPIRAAPNARRLDSMMESERSREKRHAVERTGCTPRGKRGRYEDHVGSDSESEFLETGENQDTSESDILETGENEDIHENVLENGVNDDTDDVDIASS